VLDELEDTSGFPKTKSNRGEVMRESIGMRPGRTGVKGVLRDRREHIDLEKEKRGWKVKEMNERMERMNLGGMTFSEEQAFDEQQKEEGERRTVQGVDWAERRRTKMEMRTGRFGHLREVGVSNFVGAIEDEAPGVWVVVHIYDRVSFH
jgi:hypothetical protein